MIAADCQSMFVVALGTVAVGGVLFLWTWLRNHQQPKGKSLVVVDTVELREHSNERPLGEVDEVSGFEEFVRKYSGDLENGIPWTDLLEKSQPFRTALTLYQASPTAVRSFCTFVLPDIQLFDGDNKSGRHDEELFAVHEFMASIGLYADEGGRDEIKNILEGIWKKIRDSGDNKFVEYGKWKRYFTALSLVSYTFENAGHFDDLFAEGREGDETTFDLREKWLFYASQWGFHIDFFSFVINAWGLMNQRPDLIPVDVSDYEPSDVKSENWDTESIMVAEDFKDVFQMWCGVAYQVLNFFGIDFGDPDVFVQLLRDFSFKLKYIHRCQVSDIAYFAEIMLPEIEKFFRDELEEGMELDRNPALQVNKEKILLVIAVELAGYRRVARNLLRSDKMREVLRAKKTWDGLQEYECHEVLEELAGCLGSSGTQKLLGVFEIYDVVHHFGPLHLSGTLHALWSPYTCRAESSCWWSMDEDEDIGKMLELRGDCPIFLVWCCVY